MKNKRLQKLVNFLVIGVMAFSIIALADDSDIRNAVLLTFGVYGIGMLIYCWFILLPEIRREKESDQEKEEGEYGKERKGEEESDPRRFGSNQAEDLRQAVPGGSHGRHAVLGEDLQGGRRVHGGSLQVMPRGSSLLPWKEAADLHDQGNHRRPAQEAASAGAHGQPQSGRGEDLPGRGAADEDGEDGEGRDEGPDEAREKPKGNQ